MDRPTIAITMGDPAGVGPEIVVKVLSAESPHDRCRPFIIGDAEVIASACSLVGSSLKLHEIADLSEAQFAPGTIDLLRPSDLKVAKVPVGKVDPAMGEAGNACARLAYQLAMAGKVQGVVTAPINKQAFHLAGYDYLDELGYLADLTNSPDTFIAGAITPTLWTVAVTGHIPFSEIVKGVTKENVLRYVVHLDRTLKKTGVASPRIAVAALNVHGGEGGMFGREDLDEIAPAIEAARSQGVDAVGPIPADVIFFGGREGRYQGVVCMYHDHANTGRKLLATRRGATIYLGLPVPCGTTAHGTGFDIAGKGIAEPGSLADALDYVIKLAQ